jgi:ankyrin repeat protein
VNEISSLGRLAFSITCANRSIDIINVLLKEGADLTVLNSNRWMLLNLVLFYGYIPVVKLLLKKGADVMIADNNG